MTSRLWHRTGLRLVLDHFQTNRMTAGERTCELGERLSALLIGWWVHPSVTGGPQRP